MFHKKLSASVLIIATSLLPLQIFADTETEPTKPGIPMEDVQRFSDAISDIKKYYVKPISDKELFDDTIFHRDFNP